MSHKPIVCIPCNRVDIDGMSAHTVKHSYIKALVEVADCLPLLIPVTDAGLDYKSMLHMADGILLTGSPSHICPTRYGCDREFQENELDIDRDHTSFPLIKAAIDMDMPLIAICRGFQELNVVNGGTLHQYVHKVPGKMDHRSDRTKPLAERYEQQRHKMRLQKGGIFELLGLPDEFMTNSLHQQGINKLGNNLRVEAMCEDGLVEAVSVINKTFIIGTQWHPEGDFWINQTSRLLLEGFGRALWGQKESITKHSTKAERCTA